jgi:hypothetical protein
MLAPRAKGRWSGMALGASPGEAPLGTLAAPRLVVSAMAPIPRFNKVLRP